MKSVEVGIDNYYTGLFLQCVLIEWIEMLFICYTSIKISNNILGIKVKVGDEVMKK